MKFHDSNIDKHKRSGRYATYMVYRDIGGYKVTTADMIYDVERDGWNIGDWDRDTELYPDYWAELPTVEELKGGNDDNC